MEDSRLGIIVAMEEEKREILKILKNRTDRELKNLIFHEGDINGTKCVIVECGIGKVNAARVTQILIDNFNVSKIINIGTAGGVNPNLNIMDIVIAEKLVQYDFDISAFGREKGFITGVGKYINSNKDLIEKCEETISRINTSKNYKTLIGTIASGDKFCTDYNETRKIREEFGADAVEMEGAAIAQVCHLEKIPFVVIRSISDTPNGSNNITFDEYLSLASKRCAEFLREFI